MYQFYKEQQKWIVPCFLLINNYMNWIAIYRNRYRVVYFKTIMTVYFSNIINSKRANSLGKD